jgi:para-nitrobenzyl esterase
MSVQVQTRDGRIEGERRGGHVAFRGIPFAKPPVGPLRFAAPEAPTPWSGVRASFDFGPSAPQGGSAVRGMSAEGPLSEDCLYLNVYTRAADGRRRPVLFWIHGGAFTLGSGSSPTYDGGPLCERGDVVVVTINYRLGALGALYLGAHGGERLSATANAGQLDQIAALEWVRANIEAFGGDPENVTIFGESAGSLAVCTLLVMPAAQGLFARAIAQSGASLSAASPEAAAKVAEALLAELEIADAQIERLRDLPAERIVAAQGVAALKAGGGRGFFPMHDGATLPSQPGEALASGRCAKVPFVIGTNRDEMNLFTAPLLRELDKPMANEAAVAVLAKELPRGAEDRIAALLEVYRSSRAARQLPHGNRALLGAIQSDMRFRIPSIRFAEAYRRQQPNTFMYLFTYESPAMRGALRACHALEIPFVFGTLSAPFQDRFAGTGPAVEALSRAMMDSWLCFARTGNPSVLESFDWVPYDQQRRATVVFDKKSELVDAPYEEERAGWDGIL